jgi:hypothetical protein
MTAAAGTRLALDLILAKGFGLCSFQEHGSKSRALVIPVTASLEEHWAIFVTAAAHGPKSRLSGFFSGASPKTPVIHHRQGCPTHNLRNLMEKNHDRLGPRRDPARRCDSPRPQRGWFQPTRAARPCGRAVGAVLAFGYKRYPLRISQSGSLVIYYGAIHQDHHTRVGL